MNQAIFPALESRRPQAVAELVEFLKIPSVSTQPEHHSDVRRCADWLAEQLRQCRMQVQVNPTAGHPIVVARNEHRPGRPTILVYGHYDVQPAEPLDLWQTPPFEPSIRNNAVYARGAADDKGQVWAHVQAIRAWQEHGGLPVNLILLIEGEEEIGSSHLDAFIAAHRAELAADLAVVSDTGQFAEGLPAITYGLRGLVYMEVKLTAASHDLHSGLYGGAVPNPANILCQLLATLHDQDGRVNIPGFYDDVQALADVERANWAKLPFSQAAFMRDLGLGALTGETGFTTLERKWARPTLDINGLTSGYQAQGAKTIIPSLASAKVSMRLVPNQDPAKIQQLFEQTLRSRCPATVKIEFTQHGLADPVLVPLDSPAMRLAARALELGFGKAPVFMREGGSIPVVATIKRQLGIDTLLIGFGLPDDRVHSPNEKFSLDALHGGAKTAAALYEQLGELRR